MRKLETPTVKALTYSGIGLGLRSCVGRPPLAVSACLFVLDAMVSAPCGFSGRATGVSGSDVSAKTVALKLVHLFSGVYEPSIAWPAAFAERSPFWPSCREHRQGPRTHMCVDVEGLQRLVASASACLCALGEEALASGGVAGDARPRHTRELYREPRRMPFVGEAR